jgi:T-complex protein 1 subunit eta
MCNYAVPGDGANYGVDINTGGIADSFANFVWEPAVVKVIVLSFWSLSIYLSSYCCVDLSLVTMFFFWFQINAINAATEAACLILSVDETVKNPKV